MRCTIINSAITNEPGLFSRWKLSLPDFNLDISTCTSLKADINKTTTLGMCHYYENIVSFDKIISQQRWGWSFTTDDLQEVILDKAHYLKSRYLPLASWKDKGLLIQGKNRVLTFHYMCMQG